MPQYRKLHTKVTYSLDFNDMPDDFTRLLWVLLPCGLSCEGTCLAHPGYIRSKIFPLRSDVTDQMINDALAWFADHDMIRFYRVAKRDYLWMVNFARYQGKTKKEAKSDFPPVPDAVKNGSGVGLELVQSKSSTDTNTDTDANADTDADTDTDADASVAAAAAVSSSSFCDSRVSASRPDLVTGAATRDSPPLSGPRVATVAPNNGNGQHAPPESTPDEIAEATRAFCALRPMGITALDRDELDNLLREYPASWITEAVREANGSKKPNMVSWCFLEAILRRYELQGGPDSVIRAGRA